MTLRKLSRLALCLAASLAADGCRDVDYILPSEDEDAGDTTGIVASVTGLYLLNEGNMGSNKCSLDFFDFATGVYTRNIYPERNPSVVKELGDVGNDIQIYGSRLYVVVNCSNKVEVLDARSGVRVGQVDIPNCRYVRFAEGKAYVSSYVGPVSLDKGDAVRGAVYEVDTASLSVGRVCQVGYQPDELEIIGDSIYVCNSGGYMAPDYERTVSVVDRRTMTEARTIDVAINLHRIRHDGHGRLWVSSRGDYADVPSNLYLLGPSASDPAMHVIDTLDVPCSNMAIRGDSLFFIATEWSSYKQENTITYGIVNTRTRRLVTSHFVTDGTESDITMPYGIALHPASGDIYVTDAKNYVSSGSLICYSRDGVRKWSVKTGDIPAHMAFLGLAPASPSDKIVEDDERDGDTTPDDDSRLDSLYDHVVRAPRLKKLFLQADRPAYAYRWTRLQPDGSETRLSTSRQCMLIPETVGDTIIIRLRARQADDTFKTETYAVLVTREATPYSPYTAIGYEYRPAPGQFVNSTPVYEEGDDEATMALKAGLCMANDEMVTLGAYGGYVTFGFDHTLVNHHGSHDFKISGNSFYSDMAAYASRRGGSCEPGIVMVSLDENGNGLPDDAWYELAGSAYYYPDSCRHGYEITYYRPDDGHTPVPDPDDATVTDTEYIPWIDSDGRTGYVPRNSFHYQDYYPEWIADDEMTFSGSLLAPNAVETSGNGRYYVLYSYGWGYVDNHPNDDGTLTGFDIDWAVDDNGRSVSLPGVDFIRVYTGVSQACGWLGETSTEVGRATDLWLTE